MHLKARFMRSPKQITTESPECQRKTLSNRQFSCWQFFVKTLLSRLLSIVKQQYLKYQIRPQQQDQQQAGNHRNAYPAAWQIDCLGKAACGK